MSSAAVKRKGKPAYVILNWLDITERKQAEEALKTEKNKLQSLIDAMEDGLTIQDKDYNIIYESKLQKTIFGDRIGEKCYRVYEGREKVCEGCPVEKAFKDGKSRTVERKVVMPSGEVIFWENTANPIRDANGKIVSCLEIARNITERKKAEETLQESEERFRSIVENSHDGIMILDSAYRLSYANDELCRISGYSREEAIGQDFRKFLDEESKQLVAERYLQRQRGEKVPPRYEFNIIRKDGQKRRVEVSSSIIKDSAGEVKTVAQVLDITEHKQAEQALADEVTRRRILVDQSMDGIVVLDEDARVVEANQRFAEMLGYTPEEVLKLHTWDWDKNFPPERLLEMGRQVDEKGFHLETQHHRKDGSVIDVDISSNGAVVAGQKLIFCACRDVTARRQAEELYRTLANSSPVGVYIVQDGKFVFVNPQFQKYTGFSEDELMGKESLLLVHPEDRERVRESAVEMLKENRLTPYELRYIVKNGETLWATETVTPIHYKGKRATLGNFMDITEHKQSEEALRQSKERLRTMFESATDGILVIDLNGVINEVNQRAVNMHGYKSKGELFGKSAAKLVAPGEREKIATNMRQAVKQGKLESVEYTLLKADGTEFPGELSTSALRDASGKAVGHITIVRDITERKQMEQQLKRQMEELRVAYEKLKELDQLKDNFLSTVSHELRTPLTSIKSFSEILLSYDEDKETQKEFLTIINQESNRLTRLINDFLDLSKIEAGRMQWETIELSLDEVIQTALNATQALTIETNLKVGADIEPHLPTVWCDKDRLVQVVTNLLSNAIKFTPEGGTIKVKAQLQNGHKPKQDADAVMVSVSDSGIGIAQKDQQSVFEKFKQVGDTLSNKPKGTGLGLPICKEIIEHYGGRIWLESELGKGSTFFFTLPITRKKEAKAPKAEAPEDRREEAGVTAKEGKEGKKILVVDDEANIRRFLKHELGNRGYQVLEASGGKEAIDLAREHHPDLITLDIVMPDINGHDVTAVLKNDPATKDIPILVLSIVEEKEKAYKLGANDFVTKPFTMKILTEKINRLLQDAQTQDDHKKILVVDDDKSLVRSLKYRLEKRGFSVDTAYNGKEAIEVAEGHHPNLVLLDIVMPEMDGYEVMKVLKHEPDTAQIPIVVMTGVENVGGKVKALSVGATEYLNKSTGFDQLLNTIESIIYNKAGG
jgi:PAS domain S-box-containing protein